MRRRRQAGQAITELALVAPLFAGLLLLLGLWARLTLIHLELIHLTRDAAIELASDAEHWTASHSAQEEAVRKLAGHYPLLDPRQVRLEMLPLPLPGGMSLGDGAFATLITGKKVSLRYPIHLRGWAGRLFPGGLDLTEWGVVQGDPWKNPLESVIKTFVGG